MTSNPTQLFLLADHIKLSLLERQRAISLNLAPNTQDNQISRSLESLREGLESLEPSLPTPDSSPDLSRLHSQYHDLSRQFYGENPSSTGAETLTLPNDLSLASDFKHAQSRTSSSDQRQSQAAPSSTSNPKPSTTKFVRFRDSPSPNSLDSDDEANRTALFPPSRYQDEPDASSPDPSQLSNQQIHAHHSQILAEQDSQLDTLAESIGRQRHISMQIGDELDGHVALLDDVERGVDRHQGRLDGAKRRLERVSKKAKENWGMTTIIVLIVILIFLIVVLK